MTATTFTDTYEHRAGPVWRIALWTALLALLSWGLVVVSPVAADADHNVEEAGPQLDAAVAPTFVAGNPTCGDFYDPTEFKVEGGAGEDVTSGTYHFDEDGDEVQEEDAHFSVAVVVYDLDDETWEGPVFDFQILTDHQIHGVVAKGGSDANLYDYGGVDGTHAPTSEATGFSVTADETLHSPHNRDNRFYGVSHISFCAGEATPPPEPAELVVEKSVAGDAWDGETFTFVLFDGVAGDVGDEVARETVDEVEPTATFSDLDAGDYVLCETDLPEGWSSTLEGDEGAFQHGDDWCVEVSLDEGASVTIEVTNVPPGGLVVAKEVTGEPGGDEVFSFEVDCVEDGTFDLQDGESEPFTELAAGTECAVAETDGAGAEATSFAVTVNGEEVEAGDGDEVTVTVTEDATVTVTFTNHFEPIEPVGFALVEVEKTVLGEGLGGDDEFTFTLYPLEDGEPVADEAETRTVDSDDGTVRWDGLEPGSYMLCETDLPEGWTTVWPDDEAVTTTTHEGDPCMTFALDENESLELLVDNVPPADIELVKEADVTEAEVGDTVTYTFTITNTGQTTLEDVTLTDDVIGEIALPTTTLEPGESITVEVDYVVDEADVDQDELVVENVAIAVGQPPVGDGVSAVDVAVVEIFEQALMPAIPEEELPVTGFDALQTLLAGLLTLAVGGATLLGLRLHELRGRRYGTA